MPIAFIFAYMKKVLVCAHDPMLVKSLYGVLRGEGLTVDMTEHLSQAVRMIMEDRYEAVIIHSGPFGLQAEDAVQIIKAVAPGLPLLVTGKYGPGAEALNIEEPVDLEEFKQAIHAIL